MRLLLDINESLASEQTTDNNNSGSDDNERDLKVILVCLSSSHMNNS